MPRKLVPYVFLAPYLAVFGVFWAWPIVYSIYLSFLNTRVNPWTFQPGINWGRLANDPFFWEALQNTLLIMAIQVPLMLVLATGLAVGLNSKLLRFRGFYRFAFFAPIVVGEVAYSAIFRLLFNTNFGTVNVLFTKLGLTPLDWLYSEWLATVVVVVALTWRWTGYNAMILMAGLQSIPQDLYEAATVDGATKWQQFWRITVPSLRPVLLFALVLSIIGTLQLFTEPFLITGGGAASPTVLTLGVYLYQQGFRSLNFGYAASLAYVVVLLAALFSIMQFRFFGRR